MPNTVTCVIRNCRKRSDRDKEVKYFAIPAAKVTGPLYSRQRSLRRRLLWVARINREELTIDKLKRRMRVCGHHFVSGAPSKASDETNPDWAPTLCLGYGLLPTSQADSYETSIPEVRDDTRTTEYPKNAVSSNSRPASPMITVKEEVVSDHEDYSCGEQVYLTDTSVINQEFKLETSVIEFKRESPATDFVQVSMIDSFEGTAAGINIVNKEAELSELQKLHSNLVSEHSLLQKEHAELLKEHAELKKYYTKLRDKLTDAEVDKLELNSELAKHIERCDKNIKENAALQAVSGSQLEKIEVYENELKELRKLLRESEAKRVDLKKNLDRAFHRGFTAEQLQRDDLLIECFTGLQNYSVIEVILNHVTPEITETSHVLAPWERLLLTLMRLKLSLKLQILGDRFSVSPSTVHKAFERWIYYMYKRLQVFIKWPENNFFLKLTPTFFKKVFDDCSVFVLECIELFAGRPGKLDGDYSNNKSVKFLLAFTPDGKVAFVSKEWDGKCSDKYVTTNSGFLEKLSSGDVVLAKHGFPVGEKDGFYCAKVVLQDSSSEVLLEPFIINEKDNLLLFQEYVKNITNVITNRFSLLQSALPWEMFATKQGHDVNQIEEIINVCCALINLSHN